MHTGRCLRSEGEWVCAGDCTHDNDELIAHLQRLADGCATCRGIQQADPRRHFKECPKRQPLPEDDAQRLQELLRLVRSFPAHTFDDHDHEGLADEERIAVLMVERTNAEVDRDKAEARVRRLESALQAIKHHAETALHPEVWEAG